jgi:DNA adenine methylase
LTCDGPTRPVLRWHGGKWRLAPWVISQFPPHSIYVEPFGGAGSVLLRKPRVQAEVYNDLDSEIVNVFRVLRDQHTGQALISALTLTPWAREEFLGSYESTDDPVERARRLIVRCCMGFGSSSRRKNRTGFRARAWRRNTTGPSDFANLPPALLPVIERLRGVCIENRPALELIAQQDDPATLFYADPPYVQTTRSSMRWPSDNDRAYAHDMSDHDHRALAELLHQVNGMVVLSGYACPLYDEIYGDWARTSTAALADGAIPREETLWFNPACAAAQVQLRLFA